MAEANEEKDSDLNSEIEQFAHSLPYWAKYLSSILLSGATIANTDIDSAYSFFLEDAALKPSTDKPSITVSYDGVANDDFKSDLLLTSLHNLQGVNALVENQKIVFCPQLTIIYGINGSGKTGYVRLMKKAFHSRTTEEILPNIHLDSGHSNIAAEFTFTFDSNPYSLAFPVHAQKHEFKQFSIFDNKCVHVHLNNKNQFEFRPAGLDFFSDLTEAFKKIEEKISTDIIQNSSAKDYSSLFDGDSEIKTLLNNLSSKTNIDDLKKLIPITEEEKSQRSKLEEQKAQLQTLKKDKELVDLNSYKDLLTRLKDSMIGNNGYFTLESLVEIKQAISDSIAKEIGRAHV